MEKNVKAIECRFVNLGLRKTNNDDEIHLIKEYIHYEDGTKEPNLRIIKNFKRPFWVTNVKYRDHKDKKEWESMDKLDKYECLQSDLPARVCKALGLNNPTIGMKMISDSPYLYGTDTKSTVIIKNMYSEKYPDTKTFYSVCSLDIETSMDSNRDILLITITMGNNIFTSIYKPFIYGIENFDSLLKEKMNKYIGEFVDIKDYNFSYEIYDSQVNVITSIFKRLHQWKPDFLSIWNVAFDINEITRVLERNNIEPKDVFSDPSVPKECRYYWYKEGKTQKKTASGKISPIPNSSQWHTVYTPSSFYIIDAMCTYRRNRLSKAEEESYKLDSILNKELGLRKLKFKEADGYVDGEWHEFMQTEYPVEYIVYNIFDSLSMMELEKKTKDLSVSLPLFSGMSDFSDYDSQPKRLSDQFYFLCLNEGLVLGTTGRNMKSPIDDRLLPLKGWIVNLQASLVVNNGLQNISEAPSLTTNARLHTSDLDIVGAYPSAQVANNVSKETTRTEILSINKIDPNVYRMENINLLCGPVNSLEYCQEMFNFPKLTELKKLLL